MAKNKNKNKNKNKHKHKHKEKATSMTVAELTVKKLENYTATFEFMFGVLMIHSCIDLRVCFCASH